MAVKVFLIVVFYAAITIAAASAVIAYLTSNTAFMTLYYIAGTIGLAAMVLTFTIQQLIEFLKAGHR